VYFPHLDLIPFSLNIDLVSRFTLSLLFSHILLLLHIFSFKRHRLKIREGAGACQTLYFQKWGKMCFADFLIRKYISDTHARIQLYCKLFILTQRLFGCKIYKGVPCGCVALYDIVSHGVAWCRMALHSVAWCRMVLHGVAWCCMLSHGV
jgi:hypothetical protein